MKRATLVSKGSLNRIFQEVNDAWKQHDFESAIAAMERACRLDPANIGILLDLSGMYGRRYCYAAAEDCLIKATRLSGQKAETYFTAGQIALNFGNFAMAERFLKYAADQKNAPTTCLVKLAEVYERLRQTEAATDLIDRALRSEPTNPAAKLIQARLERQAGRLENAETLLRDFPAEAELNLRANAAYELGAIWDRLGEYDKAMSAFKKAKSLLLPNALPFVHELKLIRNRVWDLHSTLNGQHFQAWQADASKLSPQRRLALLGGHPRSGTTLLEQILDAHPDIVSAEETETFHTDAYFPLTRALPVDAPLLLILNAADHGHLQYSRQQYFGSMERFLNQPIGNRLLIDKNPSLTFLIPPLLRIFPEIRLLIALRDPRDVVLSCFMQSFKLGIFSSPYLTIENTTDDYCTMMHQWQTLKPMINGRFLEVRYEDMVEDLESVARQSLTFLGVPWDAQVLGFDAHARQKLVRSPTYADVTQPVYKHAKGRWRNYQKYLEPHLAKLEPFVKAFGYG